MNNARKAATDLAVEFIGKLLPKTNNAELTRQRLDRLSDKEFEELMHSFKNEKDYLQLFSPIGDDNARLNMDNLHKVGHEYGIEFYHKIWMPEEDGSWELSNKEAMIVYLPIRVQQQLISKKISIPKDNNHIDFYTGQATGPNSKGARVSYPEVNMLLAMGLNKTVEEMMHFRGGSEKGMRLLEQSISQMGRASADALKPYSGEVGATLMLHSYLTAMMLKSTLLQK